MSSRGTTAGYIKRALVKSKRLRLYIFSGVAALIVDYLFFVFFYFIIHSSVEIAVPVGLTAGLITSFALNKFLTFSDTRTRSVRQTTMQVVLYLLLFGFNNLFTIYLINGGISFGLSPAFGKIIATVLITLWNFILYKKYIFR